MTTQRTEGARSKPAGEPCFDCLEEVRDVERPRLVKPREVAFWLIAYVFAATMLGTTLPTPLYVIWQSQWHFSSGVITLIFAVYAAGVLAALILAGRASDQVGAGRCSGPLWRSARSARWCSSWLRLSGGFSWAGSCLASRLAS
jgi:MFS family permease